MGQPVEKVIRWVPIVHASDYPAVAREQAACAVQVQYAKLNCEQLKDEIAETRKMKRDAEYAKTATGGNTARIMLFWPAWAKTLANADKAIIAADNRNFHLIKLMRKKNCKGVDAINAKITTPTNSNNSYSLAAQLKELKEMYQAGDLTKEEYEKAKRKVLD